MDENQEQKPKKKSGPRANVRFSEREYERIVQDERERGLTIPLLLKEAYFQGRPTTILLTKEDRKEIVTELSRQGNNINQIARQSNAGVIGNVQQELASIGRALTGIMALLNGKILRAKQAG